MSRAAFWISTSLIGWVYVGFPILAWTRAKFRARPYWSAAVTPSVTIIVPAHNEERAIRRKLASIAALDYPADRIEVVVASDGSTDRTVEIARSAPDLRTSVLDLPRAGKAAALNAAVAEATGVILVFSDANSILDRSSIRNLVARFGDDAVGGVAGDQRYDPGGSGGTQDGERSYWSFERALKGWESRAGNTISSTGALHAIRAALYRPVPDGLTDDFFISTGVIAQGYRLVFEPGAIAREPVATSTSEEYARKVRVAGRILATQLARRSLMDPRRHGFYAIQLLSHKLLRQLLFMPLAILGLVTPGLRKRGLVYRLAGVAQAAMYGLGVAGLAFRGHPLGASRALAIPAYFCMSYAAQAAAVARLLLGRRVTSWEHRRGRIDDVAMTIDAAPTGATL